MLVMNPIHLQTLLTIVDEGSFEDAAYVLGISPSAVSQRIKALEKTVGRLLLRRSTPVSATEAGEVLMQAARRMALLQAETMANLKERIATIPLSVAINADSLATWFPPVLARVASWDAVTLTLRIEDESHSLNLLRRGDVLGAVTRAPTPPPAATPSNSEPCATYPSPTPGCSTNTPPTGKSTGKPCQHSASAPATGSKTKASKPTSKKPTTNPITRNQSCVEYHKSPRPKPSQKQPE